MASCTIETIKSLLLPPFRIYSPFTFVALARRSLVTEVLPTTTAQRSFLFMVRSAYSCVSVSMGCFHIPTSTVRASLRLAHRTVMLPTNNISVQHFRGEFYLTKLQGNASCYNDHPFQSIRTPHV